MVIYNIVCYYSKKYFIKILSTVSFLEEKKISWKYKKVLY